MWRSLSALALEACLASPVRGLTGSRFGRCPCRLRRSTRRTPVSSRVSPCFRCPFVGAHRGGATTAMIAVTQTIRPPSPTPTRHTAGAPNRRHFRLCREYDFAVSMIRHCRQRVHRRLTHVRDRSGPGLILMLRTDRFDQRAKATRCAAEEALLEMKTAPAFFSYRALAAASRCDARAETPTSRRAAIPPTVAAGNPPAEYSADMRDGNVRVEIDRRTGPRASGPSEAGTGNETRCLPCVLAQPSDT